MNNLNQTVMLVIDKLGEQIFLVAIAMFFALVIGISAGILVSRIPKLKASVLNTANILQTIPSLALFGLLIPFVGIGSLPAIIALCLYALLPIIRNTVTGIEQVDNNLKETAIALGLTAWQRLYQIELPIALPVIMSGVRTATVMCTGIATIAAFIGAGGLGDLIYQGLTLNNNTFILLGAIPAAALALCLDFGLGYLERKLKQPQFLRQRLPYKKLLICLIIIVFFIIVIYNILQPKRKNTIIIASKTFTEQIILADILADLIQDNTHLHVIKKLNLGSIKICQQAMENGEIDIYPEYTGTAYTVVLRKTYDAKLNAKQIYQQVKNSYQKKYHITWLLPFGFNNTNAITMRESQANALHIKTISDLAAHSKNMVIGADPAFIKRLDSYPLLQKAYGLQFKAIKAMTIDLSYLALYHKAVDVINGTSTDGRIAAFHLRVLKDNLHVFPPYQAAPIIRDQVLKQHPELGPLINKLHNKINDQQMQHMNYDVNVKHLSPDFVAKQFLINHGLIKA